MHLLTILASTSTTKTSTTSSIAGLLPLLLIPVAMYFLMIKPQKKRQRQAAALQASIDVGDEVMTTSGVYGFVTGFDGDIAWLEIDDNVQIRVARASIQRKVDTASGDTATPTDASGAAKGSLRAPKPETTRSTVVTPSQIASADSDQ